MFHSLNWVLWVLLDVHLPRQLLLGVSHLLLLCNADLPLAGIPSGFSGAQNILVLLFVLLYSLWAMLLGQLLLDASEPGVWWISLITYWMLVPWGTSHLICGAFVFVVFSL